MRRIVRCISRRKVAVDDVAGVRRDFRLDLTVLLKDKVDPTFKRQFSFDVEQAIPIHDLIGLLRTGPRKIVGALATSVFDIRCDAATIDIELCSKVVYEVN